MTEEMTKDETRLKMSSGMTVSQNGEKIVESDEETVREKTVDVDVIDCNTFEKEPIKVAVIGEGGIKPNAELIKEVMKGKNVEVVDMPYETNEATEEQIKKNKEKEVILPPMGTKFMIAGKEYKVCYINAGKKRFSAEPCKGMY